MCLILPTGILLCTIASEDGNVHIGQELFLICDYITLCSGCPRFGVVCGLKG